MRWHSRAALGLVSATAAALLITPAAASSAAGHREPAATTTITLRSSAAASKYDSWVTFTARVTSSAGRPTGSVTFTDASNGSVLDTVTLHSGTARFVTAALAPGRRRIVARFTSDRRFRPSSSAAVRISVAPAGSDAFTYQEDTRHDGNQSGGALRVASLTTKWSVTLGGLDQYGRTPPVSYPVIAGGRVFVSVANATGDSLYALNARSGQIEWSADSSGQDPFAGGVAYDGRRVFAVTPSGLLAAFDASTGRELWTLQVPAEFTSPPTAYDGVVYFSGAGDGGQFYAVSEADGRIRWKTSDLNGAVIEAAVDSSGIYLVPGCPQDSRVSFSGHRIWRYKAIYCGTGIPVLHGRWVYESGYFGLILSASTGLPRTSFLSTTSPALSGRTMFTVEYGKLFAGSLTGSAARWSFGNGTLVTAPVVNGPLVFVGSSTGVVYGLSIRTGKRVWHGTAGSTIDAQGNFVGMAIGDGLLVVPAGPALTAFGD